MVRQCAVYGCSITDALVGKDSGQALTEDSTLKQATSELRTLLERFANGQSLDTIGDAMQTLYQDAQKDEELRTWFKSVDDYVRKVISTSLFPPTCMI